MNNYKKSTRELALEWWNSWGLTLKDQFSEKHFKGRPAFSLSFKEVEEIWRKETPNLIHDADELSNIMDKIFEDDIIEEMSHDDSIYENLVKPNQKQFTEFNSDLFLSYFNKFDKKSKAIAISYASSTFMDSEDRVMIAALLQKYVS